MEHLLHFLKPQKLLVVASFESGEPWVANVYFVTDDNLKLYFVSREGAKHSQQILKNPQVAFSSAWFDPANLRNRKAVQGSGTCHVVSDDNELQHAIRLYHENFPDSKESITIEWIRDNEHHSRFWVVKPAYMKHWNDERYGEDGSEEFHW